MNQTPIEVPAGEGGEPEEILRKLYPFPIVGIGASAGGLEAIRSLLQELPGDTGMAFVIVQHLPPDAPSHLTAILERTTVLTVREITEENGGTELEPNHVYVSPASKGVVLRQGKLEIFPLERQGPPQSVDVFFRSLALECRHQGIAVILSGGLSDGTLGLEAVKAEGGITFAQDASAAHDSMPRSAEASGCVDFILSPDGIAHEIERIARHPYVDAAAEHDGASEAHARIVELVRQGTGVDFAQYKANTLHRRIQRRLLLHKKEKLSDYEILLEQQPDEVQALYQDILINVTSFFRDPKAYEVLAGTVFPRLLAGRSVKDPVRIWTLACSTGQEAYSLAMAYTEYAESTGSAVPVQIFATDLNEAGIRQARAGLYPKSIAHEVSRDRLEKFFTEERDGYRIGKAIRQCCIFSAHNVLADPPFSRMDLISCRNMLIYMQPVLQQVVLPLLHYALKPRGVLWLGSSETPGTSRDLFDVLEVRHKIFCKRAGATPPSLRYHPAMIHHPAPGMSQGLPASRQQPRADLHKEAERILLAKFAPPGVVIAANLEILQFRGETGPFLAPAAGMASLNLLKMLREGLLVGVRSAILRAGESGKPVREDGMRVHTGAVVREVGVQVIPIHSGAPRESGFLVLFEEIAAPLDAAASPPARSLGVQDELAHLNQELGATRDYLQSVIEQHEAANEELQSINEEAQSANEEMHSVNEELETSKEEIQASNQELAAVNDELNNRNVDLQRLNGSLRLSGEYALSIIESMRGPLVVLDAALRVKTASAAFNSVFRVPPTATEGRLFYDLGNGQWNIPALRDLLERVLPEEQVVDDFEVRHDFDHIGPRVMVINARRLPQGTGATPLIVLAIEDITERITAEQARKESESLYRAIGESIDYGVWVSDPEGRNIYASESFLKLVGLTQDQCASFGWGEVLHPEDAEPTMAAWQECVRSAKPWDREHRFRGVDGAWHHILARGHPVKAEDGTVLKWAGINLDISGLKQAEEAVRASEQRFKTASSIVSNIVWTNDANGLMEGDQAGWEQFTGQTPEEYQGYGWATAVHPEDSEATVKAWDEAVAEKKLFEFEHRVRRHDGDWRICSIRAVPLLADDGRILEWVGVHTDITEHRRTERNALFLAGIGKDLVHLTSEHELMQSVGARLGAHFHLTRCLFLQIKEEEGTVVVTHDWYQPDLPSAVGTYRIADYCTDHFQRAGRAGEVFVVNDVQRDPRLDPDAFSEARSLLCVPMVRDGEWQFELCINKPEPYEWHATEIELVKELASRLWSRLERLRIQAALADRVAELAEADRSKDEFLAMLAHELRNPLAPMRNAAEVLATPGTTEEEREEAQCILGRQIGNMGRMIDDLLDVSRITQGKIVLNRKPVVLQDILHAAVSLARSGCQEQEQHLEVSLPVDPLVVDADATRLEQVFGNLLTNASKYSGAGSKISITAEVRPDAESPGVVVRVADNGQGIEPSLLPRIFQLFVQSSRSLDRSHGGLGIGLTLVQRLVHQHGGSVEAHSAGMGHGSEFVVHLPVLCHPAVLENPAIPAPPEGPPASLRILIVDDNADSARSLTTLQTRRGHVTRTAFTGPDALVEAASFVPDVVLLDIGLPGMDGFEVARRLRTMPALAGVLLVGMSGYGRDDDREQARLAGFDEYLVKPLDLDLLRQWLATRNPRK